MPESEVDMTALALCMKRHIFSSAVPWLTSARKVAEVRE